MSIVSCPRCTDRVNLPAGASDQATVRCPLCQEEFALSEILASLPPSLIVVDDPGAPDSPIADSGPGMLAEFDDDDAEVILEQPQAVPAFSFDSSPTTSTTATTTATSGKKRKPITRPKRKPKSPMVEMAKVLLGGVAGLVIAQLILWWLPAKYRRDPFKLGPQISQFAPWIVPEKFHGANASAAGGDAAVGVDAELNWSSTEPRRDTAPPQLSESGLPQLTFVDPNDSGPASSEPAAPAAKRKKAKSGVQSPTADLELDPADLVVEDPFDTSVDPLPELSTEPAVALDLNMLDGLDDPAIPEPKSAPDTESGPAEPKPNGTVTEDSVPAATPADSPVVDAPRTTAAELSAALKEAQSLADAWRAAEAADSRKLLRDSYLAFSKLGEAFTFAADARPKDRQAAGELLRSLTEDQAKLDNLGLAARVWLKAPQRDSRGVLLIGTVKDTGSQGDMFTAEIETKGGDVVSIYSDRDLATVLEAGTQTVLMGSIVDDPANNLVGYEGQDDSVIWFGLAEPHSP